MGLYNGHCMQKAIKPSRSPSKLLYGDLSYRVRGACFTVYNTLGFGHKELVYQNALEKELKSLGIPHKRHPRLSVRYKLAVVGEYIPDITVDEKIILELKAVEFVPNAYHQQLLHYLKSTGYQLGFLVNFGSPNLSIKRIVLSI